MKITEKIFNVETGVEEIIERDATPEEIAAQEAIDAEIVKAKNQSEVREAARQALLAKLGITADEAKLLLGGN